MVWLESGLRLTDSQCGLRVYPLHLITAAPCAASRYGYETEILTKAAWCGFTVVETDIHCRYTVATGRITHFRPFLDTLRGIAMHGRPHVRRRAPLASAPRGSLPSRLSLAPRSRFAPIPQPGRRRAGRRRLLLLHPHLRRPGRGQLPRCPRHSRQPCVRHRRLPVIHAAAHAALLISVSLLAGHLLLHQSLPTAASLHGAAVALRPLAVMRTVLLDWIVGGTLLGGLLALLTYWIARTTLAVGSTETAGAST